ncbi:MAG TPA: HEAT repeat domain-containing protein [Edaphobacter sp.]|nr:HEAT repeat domain-containing protein [Edaphobacter sp.]
MSTRWVRISVFALGAVAVGVYIAVSQSQRRSDTTGPSQSPRDPFNDNDASRALRDFLAVMYMQTENAEDGYARALERLRSQAEAVIPEIARIEATLREADYPTRFALIFAASELRNPAALPWLRSVALSRIPAERSRDPHSFSTVAEETILRTTAVDGIGQLAKDNNNEATEALFHCLATPSLSIHRASVQQLLDTPNVSRDRIVAALPSDERFLLDLRRIKVNEAPQIRNPQQTLVSMGFEAHGLHIQGVETHGRREGAEGHGFTAAPPPHTPGEEPQPRSPRSTHNPPPTLNRR